MEPEIPDVPLRTLMIPILLYTLVFGVTFGTGCKKAPRALDETPADAFAPLAAGEQAILFGGDMLLANGVEKHLKKHGMDWMFRKTQPIFESAQARWFVGNQEGPITSHRKKGTPRGKWMYRQGFRTVPAYVKAGFTHLSLANNHALDRERKGLVDGYEALHKAGIQPIGAGHDASEAEAPAILELDGLRVAIVAGMQPWSRFRKHQWDAAEERPGIVLFRKEKAQELIRKAREVADFVVVYPHWGANYAPVDKHQRNMMQWFVEAGADAVVGHHSHAAQGFAGVDGVPVMWSLGNTAFGTAGRFGHDKMRPGYGLIARLVWKGNEFDRIDALPLRINNRLNDYQPRPMPVHEAEAKLREYTGKGVRVELKDGVASIRLPPGARKPRTDREAEPAPDAGAQPTPQDQEPVAQPTERSAPPAADPA